MPSLRILLMALSISSLSILAKAQDPIPDSAIPEGYSVGMATVRSSKLTPPQPTS